MSAQTDILAEKIREIETQLTEATTSGNADRITELQTRKADLTKQLATANSSLNEGRQLLKG
jgi:hypothetical protein